MTVYAGAQAPEQIELSVTNAELADEPLDLTTVSAVSLSVLRPDGQRVTWSVTTAEQTATLLRVVHVFDALDVELPGTYRIMVMMTVVTGVRRAGPTSLAVLS